MHRRYVILAVLMMLAPIVRAQEPKPEETMTLGSPDGNVQFTLIINQPVLTYAVTFKGQPVIEPSPMILTLDGVDVTQGVRLSVPDTYEADETYPTRGVHAIARDRHVGTRLGLRHRPTDTRYTLEVRAFDDGVAFRFVAPIPKPSTKPSTKPATVPAKDPNAPRVPDEASVFTLPAGAVVWSHGMRGHYEGEYTKRDVAEIPGGEWVAPPLTFKLPGNAGYAAISEAALVNYSGMALETNGDRRFTVGLAHRQPASYPYTLRYEKADVERLSKPAEIVGTITTPWRVIMIGADLNAMVNSDIITTLSPPADESLFPKGYETEWVKPGRAVWRYLDLEGTRGPADPLPAASRVATSAKPQAAALASAPATTQSRPRVTIEEIKEFNRLAGELGFEYNVLEGFWRRWSDDELRDLVADARKHDVGLFVWVHSRNLYDPQARAELFKRLRDTGIIGLKIDFFDHEHREVIDLYHALLREAAENKILLNFHGANKPTGESRTWPNELVREAVRGMEASKMKSRAAHDATIPFTRYTVGHGEYTPVHFGDRRGDTTWAHQVATSVVFTAPLLTYGAHPRKMLDSPAAEMLKSIPATWDETIVLPPSEIGDVAVMARRKGDAWFLAVVNGTEARTFSVPLTFLGDGDYQALIVKDRKGEPAALDVENASSLRRDETMRIDCSTGGGFIARFTK